MTQMKQDALEQALQRRQDIAPAVLQGAEDLSVKAQMASSKAHWEDTPAAHDAAAKAHTAASEAHGRIGNFAQRLRHDKMAAYHADKAK